jgi:hypothetical protein
LDSIPCYQVNIEEGKVRVRARRGDLEKNKRVKPMARKDPGNNKTVLVVGGGEMFTLLYKRQMIYKRERGHPFYLFTFSL